MSTPELVAALCPLDAMEPEAAVELLRERAPMAASVEEAGTGRLYDAGRTPVLVVRGHHSDEALSEKLLCLSLHRAPGDALRGKAPVVRGYFETQPYGGQVAPDDVETDETKDRETYVLRRTIDEGDSYTVVCLGTRG